jgi:hypothetical protein
MMRRRRRRLPIDATGGVSMFGPEFAFVVERWRTSASCCHRFGNSQLNQQRVRGIEKKGEREKGERKGITEDLVLRRAVADGRRLEPSPLNDAGADGRRLMSKCRPCTSL